METERGWRYSGTLEGDGSPRETEFDVVGAAGHCLGQSESLRGNGMTRDKAREDLLAATEILQTNINVYRRQGKRQLYRVVASQLRLLLCDGRNSLLPRLFGDVRLHPMTGYIRDKRLDEIWKAQFGRTFTENRLFHQPFSVYVGEKGARIAELFNERLEPIPLEEWLDQPIFNAWLTVKELIRSVADKEAVHSDPSYNKTLKFTSSSRINEQALHEELIVCAGEYILRAIDRLEAGSDNS